MSIDSLHEKVRKLKNPLVIDFAIKEEQIPAHLMNEEGGALQAYGRFCEELMCGLKGVVPAVRFSFSAFSLYGGAGLALLGKLLDDARQMGFYIFLDSPNILSPWDADRVSEKILQYAFDALIISPYIGSDAVKPFIPMVKDQNKELVVIVRSPNKTASELQDLLTGSRLVYGATADMVNRFGTSIYGKCGYSCVVSAVSAGSPDGIRNIRGNYKFMYLFVDGLDYPSGNAKNCSFAFDRYGYGAVVNVGPTVTGAWLDEQSDGTDYVSHAVAAAERLNKNIGRYINIL